VPQWRVGCVRSQQPQARPPSGHRLSSSAAAVPVTSGPRRRYPATHSVKHQALAMPKQALAAHVPETPAPLQTRLHARHGAALSPPRRPGQMLSGRPAALLKTSKPARSPAPRQQDPHLLGTCRQSPQPKSQPNDQGAAAMPMRTRTRRVHKHTRRFHARRTSSQPLARCASQSTAAA